MAAATVAVRHPVQSNEPACQASEELRSAVLKMVGEEAHLKKLPGYRFLVAAHARLSSGIFIVDGNFGREHYKAAIQEAKDAGLKTSSMYVYRTAP